MAEITVIPAKNRTDEIIRTAAYARVSSDSEDQLNSFAAQIRYYTELLSGSTDMVECGIRQIGEGVFQDAFIRLWNKLQAHYKAILIPMLKQLEALSEREKSGDVQLANLRKEIAETKQQIHLLTKLNSQGTLDGAYFKERIQELDRKILTAQKQLNASLNDEDSERLDELRKLITLLEKSEQIAEFDEIKFGQIVEKITVLSETDIRFDLIGRIGFTERIER